MTEFQSGRYARQAALPQLGAEGQLHLSEATVVIVGCGAIGATAAALCVRGGVGRVRLIDPDRVHVDNLHRQLLFTEKDALRERTKVMAARSRLGAANSSVAVEAVVARLVEDNAEGLLRGADLVLDGLDTMGARELLNRACVGIGVPWVYAGVDGTACTIAVFGGGGPCFSCLWPANDSELAENDTAGVLNTAPAAAAAFQVSEAIRLLCGNEPRPVLHHHDLWGGTSRTVEISRDPECPVCGAREGSSTS